MVGQKVFRFVLVAFGSISSSGTGSLLTNVPISPGVASYQEWAALAGLFDEVKLHSSQIYIRPLAGSNGQNLSLNTVGADLQLNDLWGAVDRDNINTAPGSFSAVVRLESAVPIQRTVADSGSKVISYKTRPGLGWATTVAPATVSPPAGVLGSYVFATPTGVSGSVTYFNYVVRTEVMLRNRV
jgi:hypothetical protein